MKIGISMNVFRRANLLKDTLADLARTIIPQDIDAHLVITDDWSEQPEITRMLRDFQTSIKQMTVSLHVPPVRTGTRELHRRNFESFFNEGTEATLTLDSDIRAKPNWLVDMLRVWELGDRDVLVSGFNNQRHPPLEHKSLAEGFNIVVKRDVGSISWCFASHFWGIKTFVNAARSEAWMRAWDKAVSKWFRLRRGGSWVITPSVIQHTGTTQSSMDHKSKHDFAADWEQ